MPQAMDLIEKVNHPNLGVMFNLCHFLKNEDPKTLETTLEKAGSKLTKAQQFGVTIWSEEELIQACTPNAEPLSDVKEEANAKNTQQASLSDFE